MRLRALVLLAILAHVAAARADDWLLPVLSGGAPFWVLRGQGIPASVDLDFQNGRYFNSGLPVGSSPANLTTISRASTGTNLLPTSTSGFAYTTFGNNTARITPGSGLLVEEARTNSLLNSTAPATQTTASLATGTYTLWVNGSGSATSSAGTATGSGFGAATNGSANTFTLTGAGTVVVTVTGSLNAFQLELGSFGTSLIVTAGATATRAADVVTLTNVPAFGGAYTLFGKGTSQAPAASGVNQILAVASDGTNSNRVGLIRVNSTGNALPNVIAAGVTILTPSLGSWSGSGKLVVGHANGDNAGAFNGGAANFNTSAGIVASLTALNIGSQPTSNSFWNGYIERIALWPTTRLPNAALQQVTTP